MFEMIVILGGQSMYYDSMNVRFGFWFQLLYDNERHLGLAYSLARVGK